MEQAKGSVNICPFDPAKAPWPYNGEPPQQGTRETWGGMSFLRPDTASGIYIELGSGDVGGSSGEPAECEGGGPGLSVRNARSFAGIWLDARTGRICKNLEHVVLDDVPTFERYLSDIGSCGKETQC